MLLSYSHKPDRPRDGAHEAETLSVLRVVSPGALESPKGPSVTGLPYLPNYQRTLILPA